MPAVGRPKGAKDGKQRKEKKKLTSKELYAKADKYRKLADAEKILEDARKNAFFLPSKTRDVSNRNDMSISSGVGSKTLDRLNKKAAHC